MSNFIIFDEPSPRRVVVPQVRVTKNTVTFNTSASTAMGLTAGKNIAFAQDPKNPGDWYVRISEKGFPVRLDKGSELQKENRHMTNATHVIAKIKETMPPCRSFAANLSPEPDADGWYAIITKSAKCKL